MAENRAYKLNAQKQPGSKRGTYIYYYYDSDGHLTSAELSTKLFTKMVKDDRNYAPHSLSLVMGGTVRLPVQSHYIFEKD